MTRRTTFIIAAGLVLCGGLCSSFACSTPVYRYALERWYPDYYRVTIFHKGKLQQEQSQFLQEYKARLDSESPRVNLALRTVDIEGELDEHASALMETVPEDKRVYPFAALQYPFRGPSEKCILAMPFKKKDMETLLDSPLRKSTSKALLDGYAAVWVLVQCGDIKKDQAAEKLVEEYLEVPINPMAEEEEGAKSLRFGLHTVAKDAEQEKVFLELLMNSEPDLKDFDEPIAFLIFGRGRALFALVGKGINKENIEEALFFLTGPCACEVKAQNPGTDMLMTADWDKVLMEAMVEDVPLPPLTAVSLPDPDSKTNRVAESVAPVVQDAAEAASQPPPERGSRGIAFPVIGVLAVIILVVAGGSIAIMRKP